MEEEKNIGSSISDKETDREKLDRKLAETNRIWEKLSQQLKSENIDGLTKDSLRSLLNHNKDRQEEIFKSFIRNNPNSLVSVETLNGFKFTWGKKTTQKLYDSLIPSIKESEKGKLVHEYIEFYKKPEVSDPYSDFVLPNVKGDSIRISENMSAYTLLEFWASWCSGCRKKHPELIKIYKKYNRNDFNIIGVSSDSSEEDWLNALQKDSLPWINLRDTHGRESIVQYQYGIHVIPTNFLIGPEKKIIAIDVEPNELDLLLDEKLKGTVQTNS